MEKGTKLTISVCILLLILGLGWQSSIATNHELTDQKQNLIVQEEKLRVQLKMLETQLEIRQNPTIAEGITVEILEYPKAKISDKGGAATYVWEFRIVNHGNKSVEMIYDLIYPRSGYSGAVVLDSDGPNGPNKESYYSFGQNTLLKGKSEHRLYLSLALPLEMDPDELQLVFGIYSGPTGPMG